MNYINIKNDWIKLFRTDLYATNWRDRFVDHAPFVCVNFDTIYIGKANVKWYFQYKLII